MAKDFIADLSLEIFYFLTLALFLAGFMEYFWSDIILAYFNLNYLLLLWLLDFIFLLIWTDKICIRGKK